MGSKVLTDATFLCGKVVSKKRMGDVVVIATRDSAVDVNASDHGLDYVEVWKHRFVIVQEKRIVAVFIRPRISLLAHFGAGSEVTEHDVLVLGPRYFASSQV